MRKQYWVLIKDEDNQVFSVGGPVTDDRAITHDVYEAQERGREVRMETIPVSDYPNRETLIQVSAKRLGMKLADTPIV